MICKDCPNEVACKMVANNKEGKKTLYGLKSIKSEVLKTYSECGMKGLNEFMED